MIKIENINLDSIAEEYYNQISRPNRRGSTVCHRYYINHLKDFVLCKVQNTEDKEDLAERFTNACQDEYTAYTEACRILNTYVQENNDIKETPSYKAEKKRLKEIVKRTNFHSFCDYMVNQYETMMQTPVVIPSDPNNHEKLGIWLTQKLKITTCPYCNRLYTFTVGHDAEGNNPTIRPEFDHYLPKSKYPYFAISFYNLIPSCPLCNHVKKESLINFHPYEKGFGNDFKFEIDLKRFRENQKLSEVNFSKIDGNDNIRIFRLKELYDFHMDYINEIADKAHAYNNHYYDSLIHSFQALGVSPYDLDRYIWGCYLETAEHGNRPLSKLTRDILDQIGITEAQPKEE